MKKYFFAASAALTALACLTACDDSSSGASNSIPTYKTESALPDTCEMEVAKAGDAYFACFENKWIEVTDSATVEKIKEGLDEEDLKEELEDMMSKLSSDSKKPSSSSKKVESSDDNEEPDSSSSEEECTGRRCGGDNSSSSKKSSGGNSGNGGSGSGVGGGEGGEETGSKCGDKTYDPKTQYCKDDVVKTIEFSVTSGKSYVLIEGTYSTTTVSIADAAACSIDYDNKDYVKVEEDESCTWTVTNTNLGKNTGIVTIYLKSVDFGDGEVAPSSVKKIIFAHGSNYGRADAFAFLDDYVTWYSYRETSTATTTIAETKYSDGCSELISEVETELDDFECKTETGSSGKSTTTCKKIVGSGEEQKT